MVEQNSTPAYVTREILKEEISASEGRLDAKINSRFNQFDPKIETTAQSLKDYTDSRYDRLDGKIEGPWRKNRSVF